MEGYLNLRIQPWLRRMITRLLAIIPAVIVISLLGEQSVGKLLILSQVILSLQLGFAVIQLIHFVSDMKKMGKFIIGKFLKIIAWLVAGIIIFLNTKLVIDFLSDLLKTTEHKFMFEITLIPISVGAGILLIYIILQPLITRFITKSIRTTHEAPELGDITSSAKYSNIAIAIDFSSVDSEVIRYALSLANPDSKIVLIHIVESAGAILLGKDIRDFETFSDKNILDKYKSVLDQKGYNTSVCLGFGNPVKAIPKLVNEHSANILVMDPTDICFLKT